jgi:hypothetical protein
MRMSNALALTAEPLRSNASALTSQSASTAIVQSTAAHAYRRLDGGWQSYAREDVDAHQRSADVELDRMRSMLEQLSLAARRADELIDAADQTAAALFVAAAAASAAVPRAPDGSFLGDWLSWLWDRLSLGIHVTEIPPKQPTPTTFTAGEVRTIFLDIADERDIPYAFPRDGCYARADAMLRRIVERYDIDPSAMRKVVIQGDLRVPTDYVYQGPFGNDRMVEWGWHIAPAVPIDAGDGAVRYLVIDPSLFKEPVSMEVWAAAMGDPSAKPQIVSPHVYGLDHFGSPIVLSDDSAQAESRYILNEYLGHCVARGYCSTTLSAADLDILRSRCIEAGVCSPAP